MDQTFKTNIIIEIIEDKYLQLKSNVLTAEYIYGKIYFGEYLRKSINSSSRVINRKNDFLESIKSLLLVTQVTPLITIPDNIRLALLMKLLILESDENFISVEHGVKSSQMSGTIQTGGDLVVKEQYFKIIDSKSNKIFFIQIAEKLQSSNSSYIKKEYIINFHKKLDESNDVPEIIKQHLIEGIKNYLSDILILSSENIEGKNIVEIIIT